MPDVIDPVPAPPASTLPGVKLRSISMREVPRELLASRPFMSTPAGGPDAPAAPPPTEAARNPGQPPPPPGHAAAGATLGTAPRHVFTRVATERPTEPLPTHDRPPAILPATRHRFGMALSEGAGPPPMPSVALRLHQRRAGRPTGTPLAGSPLRWLDRMIRQRSWDPFAGHRRTPSPPTG